MSALIVRLLLAAALGAAALPPHGGKKVIRRQKPFTVDASFTLGAPSDWAVEHRGSGVVLTGPSSEGVATLISVRYVPPDEPLYGTPDAYMKRLTRPTSIPLSGWKDGKVETVKVVGRDALRLERDTTQFTSPHSMDAKEVAMREEHIAVPAAKGFYLLVYTAPRSIDKAQRPVFRRVVDTAFKPNL